MCGRYTLFVPPEVLKQRFKSSIDERNVPKLHPRYNIAPTQEVPIITAHRPREISFARWGLIPSWSKDESIGTKLINARSETLLEKPSFRTSFRKRRCLVIANGFYEWRTLSSEEAAAAGLANKRKRATTTVKQPMFVSLQSGEPFALAGLWDEWRNPAALASPTSLVEPPLRTCTIITTEPNSLIATMHHRMAVILVPEEEDLWLDETVPEQELLRLLKPYPSEAMVARPASLGVNSVATDDASLLDFQSDSPLDSAHRQPSDPKPLSLF